MCGAVNRSLRSVILGGLARRQACHGRGEQIAIDVDGVAATLNRATNCHHRAGHGMAVAQAQQSVSELTRKLRAAGKNNAFAIHPVARRFANYMNDAAGRGKEDAL